MLLAMLTADPNLSPPILRRLHPLCVHHIPDFNYAREPNVEERHKFSRDIYRVEDSNLAEAVGLLEQRCPEAVLRVSAIGLPDEKAHQLHMPEGSISYSCPTPRLCIFISTYLLARGGNAATNG